MVGLTGGVFNRREDVFVFEVRVVLQDFLIRSTGGKKVEDVGDADPHIPDAGTTAALGIVDGDSREAVGPHRSSLEVLHPVCAIVAHQAPRNGWTRI